MSLGFSQTGITVEDFLTIFNRKVDEYKEIYGDNLNLDQDTPDGQRIGIEANTILDLQSFAGWLYTQIDPDFSQGEMLNVISKICGIVRKPATQSVCDVNITVDRDLTLPEGWEAEDTNEQIWVTNSEIDLTTGTTLITLYAKEFGEVNALANEINDVNHVILGITSVDNPASATVGTNEESDEDLRARRNLSIENPAYSTVGEITSTIANIENVISVKVYENNTNTYNATLDLNAHSIWIVVDGGDVDEISTSIAISKTAGCGEKGSTTGEYIETLPNGETITHSPLFDRPTETGVTVEVSLTAKNGVTIDQSVIQEALIGLTYGIGESIDVTGLYSNIYNAHTNIVATALTADKGDGAVSDTLASDYAEILIIDTVTITEL